MQPKPSVDDHLIAIQRELYRANQMVNTRTFPSALHALDQIIDHAQEAFSLIGAMGAQGGMEKR